MEVKCVTYIDCMLFSLFNPAKIYFTYLKWGVRGVSCYVVLETLSRHIAHICTTKLKQTLVSVSMPCAMNWVPEVGFPDFPLLRVCGRAHRHNFSPLKSSSKNSDFPGLQSFTVHVTSWRLCFFARENLGTVQNFHNGALLCVIWDCNRLEVVKTTIVASSVLQAWLFFSLLLVSAIA